MSITKARSFIEKSGCGWITGGALILIMIASVFTFNSCGGQTDQEAQKRDIAPLATIGDQVIDGNELRDVADRTIQQAAGSEEGIDPADEGRMYSNVAQTLVSKALVRHVAKERKIVVSDDELKKDFMGNVEAEIFKYRFQMINQKLLKPDATEAEFADAFKNATGQELADVKAEEEKRFTENMKDPEKRADLEFNLLARKVSESYKVKLTITDAELKKGFETYITKRILGESSKGSPKEVRERIEKAEAEIKAGASFEAMMNKYSDDPGANGKPKSESTINLDYATLTYDVSLSPILKLKPGQVSPILSTAQGPALYKLIKVENLTPKDFETRKASIKEERIQKLATKAASDDLRARLGQVKYTSPATKLMVDWRVALGDPELTVDRTKLRAKLKSIYEGLKAANDPLLDGRILDLAKYGEFMDYHDALAPADRPALTAERIELLTKALESSPHVESFHELAKLAMAQKSGDVAFESLKNAMSVNAGLTDLSVSRYKAQRILRDQFAASKLAKPEQLKALDDELGRWKSNLYDDAKMEAGELADYSEMGEAAYKSQRERAIRFRSAGFLTAAQATEILTTIEKWKEGLFSDLKLQIEGNADYSEIGAANHKDLKSRVEKFGKLGYLTLPQQNELNQMIAKWEAEKKKYDAEQAKNAPKPEPPKSGPQVPPTTTGGGASSNDLLKGGTTGR